MAAIKAIIYSPKKLSKAQEDKIVKFLEGKYGEVVLTWVEDKTITSGFKLVAGSDIYDWTNEGRMKQLT